MNIRDLEYFVAVAELGHFRSASERCFVSQPTLSGQLKKLEEELGHALFERSTRKVILTKFGEEALEISRNILAGVDELKERAEALSNPFQGSLRLGIFPTLGPWLFPRLVSLIHQNFPDLDLYLVEEKSAVLSRQLADGELDVAFLALPDHVAGCEMRDLFSESFLVALPANHPLAKAEMLETGDLVGQELMLLSDGHCLRTQALDLCGKYGAREESRYQATGIETLRQMVRLGSGITLIPRLAVPEICEPEIAYRPVASPDFKRDIGLFYRRTHPRAELMEAIAGLVRRECNPAQLFPELELATGPGCIDP